MKIGYARVSTNDQNLDLQLDALKLEKCEKVFTDKLSGSRKNRPGLDSMKKILRKGDEVVVWKLDRLGRSLRDLVDLVNFLNEKEVSFHSIQDRIDTSSPVGQFTFHMSHSLKEISYGKGPRLVLKLPVQGADAAVDPKACPKKQRIKPWLQKPSIKSGSFPCLRYAIN